MEFESILKFSFLGPLRKESLKYVLIMWLVSLVLVLFFGLIVLLLFGDLITALLSGKLTAFTSLLQPTYLGKLLGNVLAFIFLIVLLALAYLFVTWYIGALIMLYAFRAKGISYSKFSLGKFFRMLFLGFVVLLKSVLWAPNKYLRIVQWVFMLSILLTFVFTTLLMPLFALIFLGIFLISIVPYFFALIYTSLRLYLADPMFLQKDISVTEACKSSYEMTRGRVLEIFAAALLAGIIIFVITVVIGIILFFIFSLFMKPSNADALNVVQNIADAINSLILAPINALITSFLMVAIYNEFIKQGTIAPKSSLPTVSQTEEIVLKSQCDYSLPKPLPIAPVQREPSQKTKIPKLKTAFARKPAIAKKPSKTAKSKTK